MLVCLVLVLIIVLHVLQTQFALEVTTLQIALNLLYRLLKARIRLLVIVTGAFKVLTINLVFHVPLALGAGLAF